MSQLTITLSDELEAKVRDYVRKQDYDSVSDFVREAIARTISDRPTYWERAYLAHLMDIKKQLGEAINDELLDALKGGYPLYYSFEEDNISKNELSDESMHFVMDILEMYAYLQYSYGELNENNKDIKLEAKVLFEGFDGNAGDGYLGFVRFLVKHGNFTYVKPLDKGHVPNSHSQVNPIYQRMLEVYKSIKRDGFDRRPLSLEEINLVIDARIHPEFRKD